MSAQQIQAYARLRPHDGSNVTSKLMYKTNSHLIELISPKDCRQGLINNTKQIHTFQFSRVFGEEASQECVFAEVAAPVVDGCLDGYNGTVFAYG